MDASPQFGLLLAFDTENGEFARGFEIGRLWALLTSEPSSEICEQVHASNAEMLLRLAEATGRNVRTEDFDAVWLIATFTPQAALDLP